MFNHPLFHRDMNIKRYLLVFLVLALLSVGRPAGAVTIAELQAQVDSLIKQLAVLQAQSSSISIQASESSDETTTERTARAFRLLTPNGGEVWEANDEPTLITLRMPTDQRYWVNFLLMPEEGTKILPPPGPGQSWIAYDPEFGGYHMGGFSRTHSISPVSDQVSIPEELPAGEYKLRMYLTTYAHGDPENPKDYLMVDDSDGTFMIGGAQPAPVMDVGVFDTDAERINSHQAQYHIGFYIEAVDHDIYIPRAVERDSTPDGSVGFEYFIGQSWTTTPYLLGVVDARIEAESDFADDSRKYYKIPEGDARDFSLEVELDNIGAIAGFYNLQLAGISALVESSTVTLTEGLEDFETTFISVFANDDDATGTKKLDVVSTKEDSSEKIESSQKVYSDSVGSVEFKRR
jgi:hypothetical protein